MKKWILILSALLAPLPGFAQPFSVNWFKVAGGGGTSTNAEFTVSGTFGQHDAGGPMAGAGYSVNGGFWSPLATSTSDPNGTGPVITAGPLLALTLTNVTLSVSNSGTPPIYYQWQKNGANFSDAVGVSGASNSNLMLTLSVAGYPGNYRLIAVSPYGSTTSSVVTIFPYSAPHITSQPQSITVNAGKVVSFDVDATGNPPPSYFWSSAPFNPSIPFAAWNSGSFSVLVSNLFGTETSITANLTVTNQTPPSFTAQPQSITNAVGSYITFSASATGNPLPEYLWRLNGSNVVYQTGSGGSSGYSFIATTNNSYDAVATNRYGFATSSVVTVTLTNGTVPVILAQPQSRTNQAGSLASFSVTASGAPTPNYQWRLNGSPVAYASSNYSFAAVTGGNYDVVVANYYGSVTSSVAVLTVTPPPASAGGFVTFQPASVVVGQSSFTSQSITTSQSVTPGPTSVAISSQGKMAVGEQGASGGVTGKRILIWNSIPITNGTPADVVLGQPDFTSTTSGTTASQCSAVEGVTFSPDGSKLIACDAGNNRVLIWNTVPTTSGQPADVVIGQTDFTTSTIGTAANKFSDPGGVLVTPSGKLVVSDSLNHRVLIFNSIPTVSGASADVVIGQTTMTTATIGSSASQMHRPWQCALSTDGKLLVADVFNNRVLVFNTLPTVNGASADVVIGQAGFGLSAAGTTASSCNSPVGVVVSPSGTLAIGEFGNRRVLIFKAIPTVNGGAADVVLGQPDFISSTSFNGGVTASSMAGAYQVAFAEDGRLLVPGRDMHRVMIFNKAVLDYNRITGTLLPGGNVSLAYTGIAGTNYALERSLNLAPPNWLPIVTNPAGPGGVLAFTNNPVPGTNNFWRVRSVP